MIHIGLTDYTPSDKVIEIRDKNQTIKAKYSISETDILKYTLMSEHYIEISFKYNQHIAFKRSDYILWNGEKYTLREDYLPEQENKYKYNYTLKFEATEMLFQDIQFYYMNQSLKESEWRLAGNPAYFMKIVVDNANRYFGGTDFTIGTIEPAGVKDIIFDTNTNTFDALTQIAEAYEAEWYMTGKTINLVKKVSFGAEVDFETEVSVLSMSRSEGKNSTRYTRILALGSTRNLPKDYRGSSTGEAVDAIYPKRLRIPVSKGDVIDAYPNMSPEEVVEGTVIFDEVYPKRVGSIEAIGTIEYKDTDDDTGEVTKWNAFKFKDSGIVFKEEYILQGEELRLSFQSGDLNGFDFALKFHKDGFSSTDNSQFFEIVRSDDYGKQLPNETMKPKAGDKYVLYGFNIALVSDQYVPAGEQELFDTASAWIQKQLEDTSVYECPTVIDHFKKNEMDLEVGQNIKLIKDINGSRNYVLGSKELIQGAGSNNFTFQRLNLSEGLQSNTEYTFSVGKSEILSGTAVADYSVIIYNVLTNQGGAGFVLPVSASRQTYTFKTGNLPDNGYSLLLYTGRSGAAANRAMKWTEVNLEKANKASDWSPAPEDITGAVRKSRIMGYEKKLYNIYDAIYTVGDNSTYSRLAAIEKEIKELQYAGIVYENTGNGGVYLIKQFDTTTPSDFNAYSAKASDAKYLNKQTGGAVAGDTIFQKNIQVLGSAVSDVFQNSTFTAGQLGSGFQIKRDTNGQSYMEIDNLMVRREAVFNRLTIAEIKSVGGTILLSLANMVISKVENKTATWRCYFDNSDGTIPNDFAVDDQVICRRFTGKNIKYYWSRVVSVGVDFIEISKSDKDGSGTPAASDEVIQLGNRTDINRQSAIMLSAYGSDSPSIKQYTGISSYDLTGKEVTVISPKGNKFTGSFIISTNGTTSPIYKDRDGGFQNGTVYYLNDRISYMGAYWVCVVNSTIQIPSETSLAWKKETTSQGDINNAVNNIQFGSSNLINGSKSIKLNASSSTHNYASNSIYLKPDTEYSIRIGKITNLAGSATSYGVSFYDNVGNKHLISIIYFTQTNLSVTVKTASNFTAGNYTMIFYAGSPGSTTNNSVLYEEVMVVEGNKVPTTWSPSNTDVQAGIDTAQNTAEKVRSEYKADFKVLDDRIESKVSQNDFNILGNRVSKTESNIVQLSDSITSTVEKVDTKNSVYKSYTNASTDCPSIPYSKGDIWITYDGSIKQANNTRLSGSFVLADWVDTTKYIDKSAIDNIQIGSRNYVLDSKELIQGAGSNNFTFRRLNLSEGLQSNTEYTFSVGKSEILSGTAVADYSVIIYNVLTNQGGAGFVLPVSASRQTYTFKTGNLPDNGYSLLLYTGRSGAAANRAMKWSEVKLEKANKASDWSPAPEDVQAEVDKAKAAADKAQTDASTAQSSANTANSLLADIASDNKFDPSEKQSTKKEWDAIISEYSKNISQANSFGVATAAYATAYNALSSYITPLLANLNITSDITGATFRSTFKNYYDARLDLLNAISVKAKQLADAAQSSANSANSAAQNAQNTADSKNRSYYSDTVPAVPSGGHKVGDLWYKVSLTDGCYETYRWNGSLWTQINVNVSKSRIEQTDSRITSIVEKTGINSLGNGETLWSKINQTSEQISLEIGKIQIGSRNYVLGSKELIQGAGSNNFTFRRLNLSEGLQPNTEYTFSVGKSEILSGTAVADYSVIIYNVLTNQGGAGFVLPVSASRQTYTFKTGSLPDNGYSLLLYTGRSGAAANRAMKWTEVKLEKANKASDWSPAPEDNATKEEIKSSLTLTDNKISLFSKTIELTGDTIAKSIEAEELNVGKFRVATDGKIYATDGEFSGKITATSGSIAGFSISDGKIGSEYNQDGLGLISSLIKFSSNNVFAAIGENVLPGSTGERAVGRFENNEINPYGKNRGVIIQTTGANENIALDLMGMISGLSLYTKRISSNTTLTNADVFISCNNTSTITITLPPSPDKGKMLKIFRGNTGGISINGNGKYIVSSGVSIGELSLHTGRRSCILVYDGQYWCADVIDTTST